MLDDDERCQAAQDSDGSIRREVASASAGEDVNYAKIRLKCQPPGGLVTGARITR